MGYPSRVSGKGKAGPLETGRGKHSPPANPERVTLEVLKRRDKGFLRHEKLFLGGEERVFLRFHFVGIQVLKAIIFDYNGILVDDLKFHEEAYWRAGRELGIPVARETVRQYLSHSPEQKKKLLYGDISDETWEEISRLRAGFYFELAQKANIVFPDVRPVLTSLADRYILGLISNTRRDYFERIFPQKLANLFRETMFLDEIGKPKPSPDPLLVMMERLGIGGEECCYVGDSVLDVQMAKGAGIKIFSVATGDNSYAELRAVGPDWIVDNLSELKQRLEAVE